LTSTALLIPESIIAILSKSYSFLWEFPHPSGALKRVAGSGFGGMRAINEPHLAWHVPAQRSAAEGHLARFARRYPASSTLRELNGRVRRIQHMPQPNGIILAHIAPRPLLVPADENIGSDLPACEGPPSVLRTALTAPVPWALSRKGRG